MDKKRSIAVVQMDCVVGETEGNLDKIGHYAKLAKELGAELAIFPECCTTGYFIGDAVSRLADPPDGPIARSLAAIAKANGIHLAVGSYTTENGVVRNSQLLFSPAGKHLATYHKAHLFAGERNLYRPGDRPVVVDTALGKLGMTICYDLIFPEYVRRLIELGADVIINSTNWINDPYQRDMWGWGGERTRGLASTRALENVTIVAMANRIGHEHLSPEIAFDSFGHSCIASPSGRIVASLTEGEGIALAHIDLPAADLERWRSIATYRIDRRPELYR